MLTILNLIANIFITISVAGFMIMLQEPSNPVAKMPFFLRYWIKISLALTSGGALLNVITLSTPPTSEIILNLGLGGLFSWAYFWHLKMFKEKNDIKCNQ
jgi:hypothetical protein